MKYAFTMIELIFVIVILGVLSAIALPKFASTKNMADLGAARADVATIRSSILTERQSRLIIGEKAFIPKLSDNNSILFKGDGTRTLLTYGIVAGSSNTISGKWTATDGTFKQYNYRADTISVVFDYNVTAGTFSCDRTEATSGAICKRIVD